MSQPGFSAYVLCKKKARFTAGFFLCCMRPLVADWPSSARNSKEFNVCSGGGSRRIICQLVIECRPSERYFLPTVGAFGV